MRFLTIPVLLLLCLLSPTPTPQTRLQGLNLSVLPGRTYAPILSHMRSLGANTVSLVIHCTQNQTAIDCTAAPTGAQIQAVMQDARRLGLLVILKPHIETTEFAWRGEIHFDNPLARAQWFSNYRAFLLRFADLQPDLLVIGTELMSLSQDSADWRALVSSVRQHFNGRITYAANYDEVERIPWWDAVDMIGVDNYYPLAVAENPTVADLVNAWSPYRAQLDALALRFHKPILFTEIGYQSRVSSFLTPSQRDPAIPSERDQALAYQAAFEAFQDARWWKGALWWDAGKIFFGGIALPDWELGPRWFSWNVGFVPIGKPAEAVLRRYWQITAAPPPQ